MSLHKCDRCKIQFPDMSLTEPNAIALLHGEFPIIKYKLCPCCMAELVSWLESGKDDSKNKAKADKLYELWNRRQIMLKRYDENEQ